MRNQLDGVPVVNHFSPLATGQADLQWTAPAEPAAPSIRFRVASNAANNNDSATGDNIRTLSLTLPQTIECSYALASETTSFDSDGGNGSAAVNAPEGCDWTATTEDDWIAITGEANGSGNGSVDFTVDANTTASERSGSITVEDQVLSITQSGVDCSYALSSDSATFESDGGESTVDVASLEGCNWTASANDDWITITGEPSGSGNGSVAFTVDANPTALERSGSITVEDQVLSITQSGADCSYALSSDSATFESDGGESTVDVASLEGCSWTASANDDWITITGEPSGSGNGSVAFTVDANPTALERSGSITVEGQVLTITQTGVACSYALSRSSISFDSDQGSSSVSVTSPEGCDWSAAPSENWITIPDGASGSGDGEVNFSVDANPDSAARFGSILVEDQVLSISQTGQQMADLIFPQFVNGEINGVLNATRVILRNNGTEAASGQIRFRESSSLFAAVPVNGQLTDTIDFLIASQGTFDIETDGTGTLQTGVVEVFVDGETDSVEGPEIFSILGNFVSVPSSRPDPAPRAYISVSLEESSGIAAYNPDGMNPVLVDMTLLDASGTEMAMAQLTLQPNEQLARFVDEPEGLFPDFFATNPEPFTGTVNFNTIERGIAVLGLIQKRAGGQLIAVGTSSQEVLPVAALDDPQ